MTIMKRFAALGIACAMAASLTACGASITSATMELPETIEKGESLQIVTDYTYSNGQAPESAALDKMVDKLGLTYTSSDPDVLAIDENGNIVAVATGSADITMASKDGKINETKTINVVVTPTAIEMPDTFQMSMDQPEDKLTATVVPEDATDAKITFASGNTDVLTVADDGTLTAVKDGEATITATVDGTEVKSECVVTILPSAEKITLSSTKLTLKPEGNEQLTFTVSPENADTSHKVWYSSDESIATVDEDGNIKGVKDGTCEISLAMADQTATCKVTVSSKANQNNAGSSGSSGGGQASSGSAGGSASGSTSASGGSSSSTSTVSAGDAAVPFSIAAGTSEWFGIDSSDAVFWAVLDNINAYRAAVGVAPLTISDSLTAIADTRTDQMLMAGDMSHDGYQTAEIIAQNYNSAASVVNAWAASPGHYAAMTNSKYTVCGIACAFEESGTDYWCVTLG